jgi:NAD dependent epimerase/dehydratase
MRNGKKRGLGFVMLNIRRSTVLVTGAGGFIGSHLTERLIDEAAHVRALVHYNSRNSWGYLEGLPAQKKKNIEVVSGDITDAGFMESAVNGCDVVFHLAALIGIPFSYLAPEFYIKTNIEGTHNVLRACLKAGVRKIVHTSTSETYGTARYVPIDEGHPLQGQSPYSASKIGADKIAESYFLSFGLPVAILRPFNTYGPRQSARAVIPTIICQLLRGSTIHLGSLKPVRDLTYVGDTVGAFLAVARSDDSMGEVVNSGNGKGITIGNLAEKIAELMGKKRVRLITDEKRVRPEASEVYQLVCDNGKAKALLGWQPKISLDKGLRSTIAYVKRHKEIYKAEAYNV